MGIGPGGEGGGGLGRGVELVPRPSKVIAVHLAYASRATECGAFPPFPSYYLKPPSSLVEGGGEVVRPEGCELLVFGGEIALVIGEPARSVHPEDGFAHVAYVTAATGLGVDDLRYADQGSNLRSRGADGFTPIGPRLLEAHRIDAASLKLRTWRNGTLAQEAAIADELLFPFGLLVADLSRMMTLECGDVILTGTPTGATVAEPGDVIEVEVTAGFATSGRLSTRVVAAPAGSLRPIGAMPRHEPEDRAAAYGHRVAHRTDGHAAAAPAPSARVPVAAQAGSALPAPPPPAQPPAAPAAASPAAAGDGLGSGEGRRAAAAETKPLREDDRAVVEALARVATATLAQQLRRRGLNGVVMVGLTPTRPGEKMVGRARTVRYLPGREDVFAARGGAMNAQRRAVEAIEPGEVLVIEARGEQASGTIGDLLALRAEQRGAVGIVTDGPLRDAGTIREMAIPVFHAGTNPAQLGRRHVPYETDVAVACAGVLVEPGDLLVGDADGVVVVPDEVAAEVAADAFEQERRERYVAEQVAAGASIDGLYPLGPAHEEAYRRWLADRGEG